jgi:hypothetical protein
MLPASRASKVIEHIDRHTKQIEKDNNSLKNIEIRSLEIKQSLDMCLTFCSFSLVLFIISVEIF